MKRYIFIYSLLFLLTACVARPTPADDPDLLLFDFSAGIDQNRFGGATYCAGEQGASLACSHSSGALSLTVQNVGGAAYAVWRTDLAGPAGDVSPFQALQLRMRGEDADGGGKGLRPHLYLIDQDGRRAFVDLTQFGPVTRNWATFTAPLRWFRDADGLAPDFSRLAEFLIVFEWAEIAGEFQVDEVRFVQQVRRAISPAPVPQGAAWPAGFDLTVYATGFPNATSITWDPQGRLWLSQQTGDIWLIHDGDNDGQADQATLFASGFTELVGLLWHPSDGTLYASSRATITALRDVDGDGRADEYRELVSELPWGRHQNNGMAWGPDGWLYFGIGSTGDIAEEADDLSATIVRLPHLGTRADLEILSRGNRNAYDVAFDAAGHLFATENGPDYNDAPDELNHILPGEHYGYPHAFGDDSGGGRYRTPVWNFAPHASADGIVAYEADQFPAAYRGNLFVALFGQIFSSTPVGHEVQRIRLTPAGDSYTAQAEPFITGLDRPLDVAVGPEGALYVLDYVAGSVFRLRYTGD